MSRRSVAIAQKVTQYQSTHTNAKPSEALAIVAPRRDAQLTRVAQRKAAAADLASKAR